MNSTTLLAASLFAVVSSITPGPNNMMILASGVNFGFARSLRHLFGISLGFGLMILLVGLGLHTLLERFPLIYSAMRWVGAAYLLGLAWKLANAGPPSANAPTAAHPMGFFAAAAFQWVNPKAWVMAVTAISTFLPAQAQPLQMSRFGGALCGAEPALRGDLGRLWQRHAPHLARPQTAALLQRDHGAGARGLADSHAGVKDHSDHLQSTSLNTPPGNNMTTWTLARRAQKMNPSVIREILKITEKPGIISFAGGLPSPKTFPISAFAEASEKVLRTDGQAALQYAASEGFAPLREHVAASLPWKVDPNQVLITTGSQQGLDLVAKVLIDEGSRILVETPTYLGALQAFTPMEPAVVSVASDEQGLDVGDLQAKMGEGTGAARFLYVLPNFQNPTGRSMSEARRAALVERAAALNLPIVEDNPYGDLWFDAPPPAPLTARNPEGCIYLGSFSKVLAPGLRLGYIVAPPSVYPKLLQAKQAADLHSPGYNQRVVAEVIKDGFLDRHVPTIRALYKAQCSAMLGALEKEMRGLGRAMEPTRRRHVPLGATARRHERHRAAAQGGGSRCGLRARRGVLRRRGRSAHAAFELCHRQRRADRHRHGAAGQGDQTIDVKGDPMQQRPFKQVDVFTTTPYRGNPLAVVLDGTGLDTEAMQHFTNWTNLSECTFLLPPTPEGAAAGADYRVRIFCPGRELPFAGHPTLGSCHAWLEAGGVPRGEQVVQECGVGLVKLRRDGQRLAFTAPP